MVNYHQRVPSAVVVCVRNVLMNSERSSVFPQRGGNTRMFWPHQNPHREMSVLGVPPLPPGWGGGGGGMDLSFLAAQEKLCFTFPVVLSFLTIEIG